MSKDIAALILKPTLKEGDWSASLLGRFTPEKELGTHLIRDLVYAKAGLHSLEKRKISFPCRYWNSDRPVRSLCSVNYAVPAPGQFITCN